MDRQVTATTLLDKEHQHLRELYKAVAQEPSGAEKTRLTGELLKAMEIHFWMEERRVYPLLARVCPEDGLVLRLGQGHGDGKRLISEVRLAQLEDGLRVPGGALLLARLMMVMQEHMAEEETLAWPILAADTVRNEELGGQLATLKAKMDLFPPIAQSIDLAVPVRVAYNQWTQFEDFPRFLGGVSHVRQLGPTRVQWHAEVAGKAVHWTSEIYEQIPDVRIAWSCVDGALNTGAVSFRPLGPDATRMLVELTYEPQGLMENLGAGVGLLSRQIGANLNAYRAFIEDTQRESGAWRAKVEGNPLEPHFARRERPGAGPA